MENPISTTKIQLGKLAEPLKRRAFMKYAGVSAGAVGLIVTGCMEISPLRKQEKKEKSNNGGVRLGSGDIGILNYAYALEQLEAAFYIMVVSQGGFSSVFSAEEQTVLTDIREHEIIHREFLRTALGSYGIKELKFDFSSVNFSNRESVLNTAKAFEDLGVSAYNGAGSLIVDVNYLLVAGKIVSVEARHAAAIRDLLNPKSADFAGDDVVDSIGLDVARTPSEVLAVADPFFKTKLNGNDLPTS